MRRGATLENGAMHGTDHTLHLTARYRDIRPNSHPLTDDGFLATEFVGEDVESTPKTSVSQFSMF